MPSLSSSPTSSASGLPASPYATSRRILILNGRFAQHVAFVKKSGRGGKVDAIVQYGHIPGCLGKPVSLTGGDYVSTDSPTCPALPRHPSFTQMPASAK